MARIADAHREIMSIFESRYGDELNRYKVPPPVFSELGGEFLAYDREMSALRARFPIDDRFLNPYGVLQGGIIAAAVDNTLGPLSMLIAPPNLTRRLEMKYSRPATPIEKYLVVDARLTGKEGRKLSFSADVRTPEGQLIARARAVHWITMDQG